MAAVLLTVLKIIGIVLLCIIGLLLVLVCLILFVPIRYRIEADRSDPDMSFTGSATGSFLLHILTARATYDEKFDFCIKVFGIRIKKRSHKEETPKIQDDQPEAKDTGNSEVTEEDYSIDWNKTDDPGSKPEPEPEPEKSSDDLFEKIEAFIDKLADRYNEYSDKYDRIRKEIRFWDRMINDCGNKRAVELIKREAGKLLKKIAPRRIKGYIHFGSDDPATTGKILMYLSMIYPVLPRKLILDPDFEDPEVFGYIDIKGGIRLIVPLVCAVKVYFNRDFKRMWRIYRKHSGR